MERQPLSPTIFHLAENTELSLGSLQAIAAIRARLDVLERAAMLSAREKGATNRDIAEALNLTTQSIYYRFRSMKNGDGTLLIGSSRRTRAHAAAAPIPGDGEDLAGAEDLGRLTAAAPNGSTSTPDSGQL